ncbi:rab-GTPase-TBC domain-containing protein [Jimgerdemannia flammicorona]|uniref:Rab-GTPase-TBC domain-containing protein n=1 Tax=Jimgerdemannia flammicorona TaxID=994334 RepID=A0A433QUI9_9FUNG|nr:rab-GTPase-TBC domain-containing protein [Jimgerdemannia flammicorona]
MIIEILWHNPNLHYYQGFHDVCTTFLLVLGKRLAILAAENVAMFFLRDGMLDSIDPVSRQLSLVTTLLKLENPGLHEFLMNANIMPFYTLSWVLMWFSHDLTDFDKVMRLFDLFMASTPLMPIYVTCAIVLSHGQELLLQEPEMVHMYLVNLPQDPDMDIDEIIQMAIMLEKKYPLMDLQKRSGTWLDECSPVNTYETEWRCLDADTHRDRIAMEQCLTMPLRRMMDHAIRSRGRDVRVCGSDCRAGSLCEEGGMELLNTTIYFFFCFFSLVILALSRCDAGICADRPSDCS